VRQQADLHRRDYQVKVKLTFVQEASRADPANLFNASLDAKTAARLTCARGTR
jgi:hypothetical protein